MDRRRRRQISAPSPPAAGALLAASLAVALPACGRAPGETAAPPDEKPARVQVVRPERQDIVRRIQLPGTVRADQEVKLHAKVTGFVKSIVKDRGDAVKAGELIATLDIPEMALERDSLQASFALEDATLRRLEAIRKAEKTAVTDQDLDVARAKRTSSEAALKRLDTLIGYAEIRAPFDGVVTERFVDAGALVQQGPVVTVMDASKVRILVDAPEPEVRFVKVGAGADVKLGALPGKTFVARVARRADALDVPTRTMRAELDAPNPDGALLPGMYAAVSLELERHAGALLLPGKAILIEQGKPVVWTASDGRAKKVPITTGIDDGVQTEVTSGLAGAEAVILPGAQALTNGVRVEVSEKP